jgi:hypothetical protein
MWRAALLSVVALLASCGNREAEETPVTEQAVIVHFNYGNKDWAPFFAFEEKLESAISAAGVGEYDGNELAADGSDGTLFMYGPDADKLFAVVKPHLEAADLLKNIVVTIRYGAPEDASAREATVRIGD